MTDDRSQNRRITLIVNGRTHVTEAPVRRTLADVLRQDLGLTGTHLGCEHGVCGACTILLDGASARACLILAVQAEGHSITTIEGLDHPLQAAFAAHHALQCGFCTPGMLTTLVELLAENPAPTAAEIRVAISGNLCRCTGYETIIAATLDAAARMRAT